MITRGKEYTSTGEDAQKRNIRKRRVCYVTASMPTPEQKKLIDRIERGVVDDDWDGDPYSLMRLAEYRGVDMFEEEERPNGRWFRVPSIDLSLMQMGAL